mgnify:CR=1 FL=1
MSSTASRLRNPTGNRCAVQPEHPRKSDGRSCRSGPTSDRPLRCDRSSQWFRSHAVAERGRCGAAESGPTSRRMAATCVAAHLLRGGRRRRAAMHRAVQRRARDRRRRRPSGCPAASGRRPRRRDPAGRDLRQGSRASSEACTPRRCPRSPVSEHDSRCPPNVEAVRRSMARSPAPVWTRTPRSPRVSAALRSRRTPGRMPVEQHAWPRLAHGGHLKA